MEKLIDHAMQVLDTYCGASENLSEDSEVEALGGGSFSNLASPCAMIETFVENRGLNSIIADQHIINWDFEEEDFIKVVPDALQILASHLKVEQWLVWLEILNALVMI